MHIGCCTVHADARLLERVSNAATGPRHRRSECMRNAARTFATSRHMSPVFGGGVCRAVSCVRRSASPPLLDIQRRWITRLARPRRRRRSGIGGCPRRRAERHLPACRQRLPQRAVYCSESRSSAAPWAGPIRLSVPELVSKSDETGNQTAGFQIEGGNPFVDGGPTPGACGRAGRYDLQSIRRSCNRRSTAGGTPEASK